MKKWFKENLTTQCRCHNPKTESEIYCTDCAYFWYHTLLEDNLPFANKNCKVSWMNDTINYWIELKKKLQMRK